MSTLRAEPQLLSFLPFPPTPSHEKPTYGLNWLQVRNYTFLVLSHSSSHIVMSPLPYFSPLGNEDLPENGSNGRDRLVGRGGHLYYS